MLIQRSVTLILVSLALFIFPGQTLVFAQEEAQSIVAPAPLKLAIENNLYEVACEKYRSSLGDKPELLELCNSYVKSSLEFFITYHKEYEMRAADIANNQTNYLEELSILTIDALKSQAFQAKVIFYVVIFLTIIGGLLSAMHFYNFKKNDPKGGAEFTISNKEIIIKTSWIGVVFFLFSSVLLISYMYLAFPIELRVQ